MDFITGLPRFRGQHDSIWVIVDRTTKSAHFLSVKTTLSAEDYAKLYIQEVVRLHGVPVSIISDRGAQFTARFWKSFLRRAWVQSYHSSIQMAPYGALCGRRCRYPTRWFEVGEAGLIGLDLVHQAMEKVKVIQERLKMAQSRQKSYTDVRRRVLEFEVDDWVYLKVSPIKGIMRFGKKGKLCPRYIGPDRIAKRIDNVAYELELPQELAAVHPDSLSYEEIPVQILDRQVRRLRTKDVASVKFMGCLSLMFAPLAGYYRRFVEGFSSISYPSTKLTQKTVKFQWSEACEKSFQELKKRLTSAPVLTLPEGTQGFVVYCDASRVGLGCFLMQNGKVIAYASRQLKVHEKNYPTHDLELAVVKELNLRQMSWLELLKDYDLSILYHPGKANVVADLLRRLSMGSIAHIEERRRVLAKDVQRLARLGVRLTDSAEGGIAVTNGAESSVVSEVKETQDQDPILLELCVPMVDGLQEKIMDESLSSRYSIHPDSTKMYHDLREVYWWNSMKKDIAEFVAKCPNCQQVKVENQRPGGLAQRIEFLGDDQDGFHHRVTKTLEHMLRDCIIGFKGNWDDHLPLIEFAYNNSYHSSIQMAPYGALCGRRCRYPTRWFEVGEAGLIGLDLVHQAMEKVKVIQERLKMAQSRQKSYTDVRRRVLEFEVDDWVYLKVSPIKGIMRFGKKGKLSPRYIGPYRIAKRIDNVAYELELPQELAAVHPDSLSYVEIPVQILDRQVRRLRTKDVASAKVLWRNQFVEESTWEVEEDMKKRYPHLFESRGNADQVYWVFEFDVAPLAGYYRSFQELKKRLTTAPVLNLPEGTQGFVVYCDASRVGLGCVLMQNGKVIAFATRQLKVHEKNYLTHDLELAAVVFALNIWRHYFYGAHVDVFTDLMSLQYVFPQKKLHLRQRRWLELLKDYDLSILYHPGKDNVVADFLSRLSMGSIAHIKEGRRELAKDVHRQARLGVRLTDSAEGGIAVTNGVESSVVLEVKEKQDQDPNFLSRLCVPMVDGLQEKIMEEAHSSRYSIHPDSTKMYRDLREVYWWNSMKKGIAEFVAKCPNCQQMKVEHQRPDGLAQRIELLGDDQYRFHHRVTKKGLGSKVNLSTAFHPQTDGQAERTIQTLEDMLRACIIGFKASKWLHMKLFMGDDVDILLDGLKLVKQGDIP
ncbi:hypothetical protein KY290_038625 [Solanum tuberosum]|uniref:Integrase catalytic domain-containing protein n=1 Tax=Solanum tuberosum TaxID=4113 RepID=A0ABQ7TZJ7_SOLTU|nr:hypothetical protein KY290_038625 [Solanum tuberosum]